MQVLCLEHQDDPSESTVLRGPGRVHLCAPHGRGPPHGAPQEGAGAPQGTSGTVTWAPGGGVGSGAGLRSSRAVLESVNT